MLPTVPASWRPALQAVLDGGIGQALATLLAGEEGPIYPPLPQVFRALELTPLASVKVVILGQDPYHGRGQATGLAFAVPPGERVPPSLRNIHRELADDCEIALPSTGDLAGWARQGVLLLNTVLTVRGGSAGSHAGAGWEAVTDAVVSAVAEREDPAVFILWGAHAQTKAARIAALRNGGLHLLINSPHPSPLSAYRGFFGSRPFSQANAFLKMHGRPAIDWSLTEAD